jgi:hypothetical protein
MDQQERIRKSIRCITSLIIIGLAIASKWFNLLAVFLMCFYAITLLLQKLPKVLNAKKEEKLKALSEFTLNTSIIATFFYSNILNIYYLPIITILLFLESGITIFQTATNSDCNNSRNLT